MSTLVILISSFLILVSLNRYVLNGKYSISHVGRMALAIMLGFTGASHFVKTAQMVQMMPDFLPYKTGVVYTTGLLEIMAAVGLLFQKWAVLVSVALIGFFVAILPANIVGSLKRVDLGGMENGPLYLFFRIPLQIFFIWWTYYFGIYLRRSVSTKQRVPYSHS